MGRFQDENDEDDKSKERSRLFPTDWQIGSYNASDLAMFERERKIFDKMMALVQGTD